MRKLEEGKVVSECACTLLYLFAQIQLRLSCLVLDTILRCDLAFNS